MDGLPSLFPRPAAAASPSAGSGEATQRTLKAAIDCVGVGVHTGARVAMALRPAPADHGIVFRRRDLGVDIPARFDLVADTRLCTVLAHPTIPAAWVGTVEHVMAALAGLGVTNALVELDGPEVPILDGSAAGLVFLIDCAGTVAQPAPLACLEVLRPVRVAGADGAFAELAPPPPGAPLGLAAELAIAFDAAAIGRQAFALQVTPDSFRRELAPARTFARLDEIEALRAAGLARGGSLDNAVVVDGARILNPAGLRMEREFVRHKLLDAVGDLALAGLALHARFRGERSGHALNNRLLRALFADADNWRAVRALAPAAAIGALLPTDGAAGLAARRHAPSPLPA